MRSQNVAIVPDADLLVLSGCAGLKEDIASTQFVASLIDAPRIESFCNQLTGLRQCKYIGIPDSTDWYALPCLKISHLVQCLCLESRIYTTLKSVTPTAKIVAAVLESTVINLVELPIARFCREMRISYQCSADSNQDIRRQWCCYSAKVRHAASDRD